MSTRLPSPSTSANSRYDVVVVGAGHNGLIAACYLAKAGWKVAVVERRAIVGGAVCTEELIPGYRFDVGSSAHIMFRATPIYDELDLANHGLEYIEMDPWAFHPVEGTAKGISFYRSVEKTCESIAQFSRRDAEAYQGFVEEWGELNEGIFEVFLKPPTPGALAGTMLKRNLRSRRARQTWGSLDRVRQILSPYGSLIQELFECEPLRCALTWLAAQSGPGPEEVGTGDFLGWYAMLHRHGAWRAKGGSGMLTQALASVLQSLGGEIVLDCPVESIAAGNGGAPLEVRAGGRAFPARSVLAACHVQTTFLDLLDRELCPVGLRERVERIRVANGFGMVVRHAVTELPRYLGQPYNAEGVGECHSGLQLLCPSRAHLMAAYRDYEAGRPPREPAVLAMTFSALDPTLAPPGGHVMFTWAQYHPYALASGEDWPSIEEREADKIYEMVCRYAPNMRDAMVGRYIQTPAEIERVLAMPRGNVMHVDMSLDQMFAFRPLPELASYRTPVKGLYLTGASTHPGGGVFGASGRNAAHVMLADRKRRRG